MLLLTAAEEIQLSRALQVAMRLRSARVDLAVQLGRTPTPAESAAAARLSQREYASIIAAGDRAREKLLLSNLRLVISIARRFTEKGLPLEDLVQEGNLGLVRAAEKFDPEMGNRFSTYATYWIRQGCSRAIADQSRIIRIPAYMNEFMFNVRRTRSTLSGALGRMATDDEVATAISVDVTRVAKLALLPRTVAIDTPLGKGGLKSLRDGQHGTLEDILPSERPDVNMLVDVTLLRDEIEDVLAQALPPLERDVLRMRYGLDDGVYKTYPTVGSIAGLKPLKVRSIEQAALRKLRKQPISARLSDFVHLDLDL